MRIERTFTMNETPDLAQERFRDEIGPALRRMGFRLADDTPGNLCFLLRPLSQIMRWNVLRLALRLAGWDSRLSVRAGFAPQPNGSTFAEVYGHADGELVAMVDLLGRRGHWPENREDPDWIPEQRADPLAAWDGETIDPAHLDRITRRALKKAGRLRNDESPESHDGSRGFALA